MFMRALNFPNAEAVCRETAKGHLVSIATAAEWGTVAQAVQQAAQSNQQVTAFWCAETTSVCTATSTWAARGPVEAMLFNWRIPCDLQVWRDQPSVCQPWVHRLLLC